MAHNNSESSLTSCEAKKRIPTSGFSETPDVEQTTILSPVQNLVLLDKLSKVWRKYSLNNIKSIRNENLHLSNILYLLSVFSTVS